MIRHATPSDKVALIGLARDFHAATGQVSQWPFDPVATARTLHGHIGQARAVALVLDLGAVKGALLGSLAPLPFCGGIVARETAFWIDPRVRGRWAVAMIREYEEWAKSVGAVAVGLACLEPRAGRLFERMGFTPVETMMIKET